MGSISQVRGVPLTGHLALIGQVHRLLRLPLVGRRWATNSEILARRLT